MKRVEITRNKFKLPKTTNICQYIAGGVYSRSRESSRGFEGTRGTVSLEWEWGSRSVSVWKDNDIETENIVKDIYRGELKSRKVKVLRKCE